MPLDVFMSIRLACVDVTYTASSSKWGPSKIQAVGGFVLLALLLSIMVVAELLKWRAPPLLVFIVIMLASHSIINHAEDRFFGWPVLGLWKIDVHGVCIYKGTSITVCESCSFMDFSVLVSTCGCFDALCCLNSGAGFYGVFCGPSSDFTLNVAGFLGCYNAELAYRSA